MANRNIVLFDGKCGFCNSSVNLLLRLDSSGVLLFAPLQGQTAALLSTTIPEITGDVDTIVFVEELREAKPLMVTTVKSEAVFRICRVVGGIVGPIAWFSLLPVVLTDFFYDQFAKIRYKIFGKLDHCRVPSPSERERFLP